MKALLAAGLFALTVGLTAYAAQPDRAPDEKKAGTRADDKKIAFEGGYTIVSGEEDGKEIPAERIKGSIVKFTGEKIVGTDKDRKEFFAASYTLDTSKTPWVINMKSTAPKEATATGLIKKDGDTVTIIYALPGGAAPTDFKTKEKQQLFVLKNMNKDAPKDPNKFTKD